MFAPTLETPTPKLSPSVTNMVKSAFPRAAKPGRGSITANSRATANGLMRVMKGLLLELVAEVETDKVCRGCVLPVQSKRARSSRCAAAVEVQRKFGDVGH